VANPAYPTVPNAPGVPAVNRLSQAVDVVTLATSDAAALYRLFGPSKWGIVDQSNTLIFSADTVLGVDFRREWRISDYPIEQGAFSSYNKVVMPYDVRVTFAIGDSPTAILPGASQARRTAFLKALDAASESLNFYNVITPDCNINNVNIVHYSYDRRVQDGGASMIVVEVWLRWVRTSVTSSYTTSQNPAAQATANAGTVQTTAVPPASTGFDSVTSTTTPYVASAGPFSSVH
jgi:hypothetical protein